MTGLTLTPLTPGILGLLQASGSSVALSGLTGGSVTLTPASSPTYNINTLNSATYGVGYSFGNTPGSFTFSGSGTPPDIYAPLVIYQRYGVNAPNVAVTKTTQAFYSAAAYYGPPTDDSSECGSCFVALKDTGTPFTSTKPHTSFEAIAQLEGGNQVTGASVVGLGSRINLAGTSHADTIEFLHMSLNASGGGGGTATNAYGVRQLTAWGATNSWGAYFIDGVQGESSLRVAKSGNGMDFRVDIAGPSAFIYAKNPDGQTTQTTMRIDAIASQTAALTEWHDTAGNTAASVSNAGTIINQSGTGFIVNKSGVSRMGMNRDGLIWIDSALEQTTVGAAGGASALPATPTKYLKVQDHNGTVLVIPAYAS